MSHPTATHWGVPAFGAAPLVLAVGLSFGGACGLADETDSGGLQQGSEPDRTDGIMPSLSAFLPPDSPLRLRFPDTTPPDDEPVIYGRRFPYGAQAAVDRGITLPKPFGLSITYVENIQEQLIDDLSVALGKGSAPPAGTDLVDLPFVDLQDVESDTTTKQIRADLWVLPFLNVFGALGKVDGTVDLTVVANVDETGLCPPLLTCRTISAGFESTVDTYTATLGIVGAYGWENWFINGSASGTASFGGDTEDAVRSYSVSGRFGRRWAYGQGQIVAPFIGLSYLHLDQVVEGTASLSNAFPDGDSLDIRYRARIQNSDKLSGIVGLNLGFLSGVAISGEVNFNNASQRTVISATYRF